MYGANIVDRRIFCTTKRTDSLYLEVFEVAGSGSGASVSLVESSDLGLNMTTELAALTSATDNIVVVTYGM